jgi:hypothetical protein
VRYQLGTLQTTCGDPDSRQLCLPPGETDKKRNYGGGKYEVVGVDFHYREDSEAHPFIPATTSVIEIMVRKIAGYD